MAYRGFIVLGGGIVLVLGMFLIFVAAGWPGAANKCITDVPNSCYCESFSQAQAVSGAPGVRQPVNTWFNLYSLITSVIVAGFVYYDRKNNATGNAMRSGGLLPDLYIFAVLFLGLGSMWFHGSLKEWGGVMDLLSMFVFAAFLVFYTVRRLWNAEWFFWVFYPITVVLFTIIGSVWEWRFKSLILIIILVVAYLALEVAMWKRSGKVMQGKASTATLWVLAVLSIITATIFWSLSQHPGSPLCYPDKFFQPHGLIWHPLAGVMAVLLYFYWREDEESA